MAAAKASMVACSHGQCDRYPRQGAHAGGHPRGPWVLVPPLQQRQPRRGDLVPPRWRIVRRIWAEVARLVMKAEGMGSNVGVGAVAGEADSAGREEE